MLKIVEELSLAEQEMRQGGFAHALEILLNLKKRLESSKELTHLNEQERIQSLVKVLNNLGVVHKNQGDFDQAAAYLEASFEISERMDGDSVRMRTGILSNLGLLYSRQRMYAKAKAAFDEALKLAEANPDSLNAGFKVKLRNNRALFFVKFGEPDRARDELAQALEAARDQDFKDGISEREAWLNANLAMIHAELGEEEIYDTARREELFRHARSMFLRSAELYGGAGYLHHKLKQLINVAEIEIRLGATEEARKRLREARRDAERINAGRLLCEVAQVAIELALRSGERDQVIDRTVELLNACKDHDPADLPTRLMRLENVLRQAGQKEAMKLVTDFRTSRKSNQNVPESHEADHPA
jgi:tetratricopeptide (TPR) repeat protein